MKKIMLCVRMPHNNSYVGGVVTILKAYISHEELFYQDGYRLAVFDYQVSKRWNLVNRKVQNFIYIFQQKRALNERLKEDSDLILNIHTSREYLFLKDILLAKMAAKKYKVPVIMTIHVGDIKTVFHRIRLLEKKIIKWMNKYVAKVIFLSDEMQRQFIANGMDEKRCKVLYNFHDMESISENEKLQRTSKLHLIFVGAIHREKGILELLTALDNLSDIDFHLDLCGQLTDKTIESEFSNLISRLGDRVTLCGYVSGKQKTALFERADILVLPSYHEGMPLVILEGMSQGCALISTKVGSTSEILDENNVIWTAVKSHSDIEEAVRRLYELPDDLKKMKQENQALSSNYTLKTNIDKLCRICSEIEH